MFDRQAYLPIEGELTIIRRGRPTRVKAAVGK